ncbi:MAG: PDZ domain-containing protein, partial [Planctomycetia bacterium]|nr:PDZ domain-containing protein [Planctomycetia bacterium]
LGVAGADRDGKATLTQVIPNGPGAKAGLKEGDVVVAIEGKEIDDYDKLLEAVRGKDAGDKIALKISRGNESLDVTVALEDRPAGQFGGRGGGAGGAGGATGQPRSDVYLGIQGTDGPEGGAKLTQISESGPAEKAGLEDNDIVQAIDGQKIADYQALVTAIGARKAGDKLKLTVLRGSEAKEIEVTLENRPGGPTRTRPYTFSYFGQSPNIQDQQGAKGYEYGGVYRSDDGGDTWQRVNSLNTRPMYFSVIRVDPSDANKVYVLGVSHFQSTNGGLTFTGDFGRGTHADGHALWIDPRDGRHMLLGCDGGFYASYDRGRNWDHINTTALGQFYHVAIGLKEPYWVVGGLQDNGSWGGPAISKSGGVINEDWLNVGGGDGFVCRVDADDPDLVYSESQNGTISRRHLKTGERAAIRSTRPRGAPPYRFNWNTPFLLSSHNAKIFYSAGNFVFRSLDRGNNLQAISPEITLTKRGSATALAESTRNPNILYAGTDDGALWATRDGGHEWKDITKNLGIRDPRWVATIEASRYADGRLYVTLDGHRSDDDEPYAFVSEDYGQTFRSIRANLPWGSTRCLREDIQNENLLFCGTEFGLWTSLDRGAHWTKLNNNLPTVAVHEVAMHPSNGEIVAATHGRSLWACDISALRQLSVEHVKEKIALFKPAEVVRWQSEPARGRTNRRFASTNPAGGAQLWYALPKKAERVTLRIEDIEGKTVRELRGSTDVGLNRVA